MKKALVIDDDDTLRGYFAAVLESLGITVFTADDGDTGISTMKSHPDVDLVVLDLKMKRMDGRSVFPALKEIRPDVKVMVSSAFVDEEEKKELLDLGIDAVLKKPFPILSFKAVVIDLLRL